MREQAAKQRDIAAGRDRQKQIGLFRRRRATRIDDDELRAALLLVAQNALKQDRMTPGRIGADQHDEIGAVEILIASRHDIGAEGALVSGDRRGHAEPRIGVDIGRADEALDELVGRVIILGQQLAGEIEGDSLRPMRVDHALKSSRDMAERFVPARATQFRAGADHRMQQSPFERQRFLQGRAFGAQPSEIRRMLRVAGDCRAAAPVRRRQHAAADAAIRTGGRDGNAARIDSLHQ